MFKNLENEYKIGQRKGDCEKYHWIAGLDNTYPNRNFDGDGQGAINQRTWISEAEVVLGPPLQLGDFPFEFDNTFDLGEIYDGDLFQSSFYNAAQFPLASVVVRTENKFSSSGPGSQGKIIKFEVLRTNRMHHSAGFKCPVEIFSVKYFDPDANSAFITFEAASEKLCDKCANPSDTNLDFRIILDEPSIAFRDKPHDIFDLSITRDDTIVLNGELDSHTDNIGIEEIRKFYFITEPLTAAFKFAADFNNSSNILWDDPDSVQPGLVLAPPPGSSLTAFGYLYTLDYKISGSDRVVGRLFDPPGSEVTTVGLDIKEWTPSDFFRNEVNNTFIYDEDRADRLWSTNGFI